MKIISRLEDKRIGSENYLLEMTIKEYLDLAKKILDKNEYQRRRVKGSNTIYSLLKSDLMRGCIIPPIVLAISYKVVFATKQISEDDLIREISSGDLLILDGLQRTYTLLDLENELKERQDTETINFVYNRKIRIEIYTGIDKLGILYRMLTLNTGQTPVSLRHQIEILYLDYLSVGFEGIKLLREIDENSPVNMGEYKFEDAIEGLNSYIERDELPMDRIDVLENIQGLERLSKENQKADLFKDYITAYNSFLIKIDTIFNGWRFNSEEIALGGTPFGETIHKIFVRSQPMTGFGAAIGRLIDFKLIKDFQEIKDIIAKIKVPQNTNLTITRLLKSLDEIKNSSKKIGNSQRMFFQYFFRELFNKEGDAYLDLDLAIEKGYRKYQSQV
jgi:hypothetical protein